MRAASCVPPPPVRPQPVRPRLVRPRLVQPRLVQPRLVQPRLVQPRLVQPRPVQPRPVRPRYARPPGVRSPTVRSRTVPLPDGRPPAAPPPAVLARAPLRLHLEQEAAPRSAELRARPTWQRRHAASRSRQARGSPAAPGHRAQRLRAAPWSAHGTRMAPAKARWKQSTRPMPAATAPRLRSVPERVPRAGRVPGSVAPARES